MAECSALHGDQTDRRDGKLTGRRGAVRTRGYVQVEQVREIVRSQALESFEGEQQEFKLDSELDGEPMKLLKVRGDVMEGGNFRNDTVS